VDWAQIRRQQRNCGHFYCNTSTLITSWQNVIYFILWALHCKIFFSDFPIPGRDVTNQTIKLFPARESLVSDIPAIVAPLRENHVNIFIYFCLEVLPKFF
jgi:hypothetical protein